MPQQGGGSGVPVHGVGGTCRASRAAGGHRAYLGTGCAMEQWDHVPMSPLVLPGPRWCPWGVFGGGHYMGAHPSWPYIPPVAVSVPKKKRRMKELNKKEAVGDLLDAFKEVSVPEAPGGGEGGPRVPAPSS